VVVFDWTCRRVRKLDVRVTSFDTHRLALVELGFVIHLQRESCVRLVHLDSQVVTQVLYGEILATERTNKSAKGQRWPDHLHCTVHHDIYNTASGRTRRSRFGSDTGIHLSDGLELLASVRVVVMLPPLLLDELQ